MLSAPVAGVVTKVAVIEGQHVNKGDVLVELNSSTTTEENAAQQVERQKTLYAQQNTSLKNLQDAEAQLALLHVIAPLSGTAARVKVKPGQAVDVTTVVAEVIDLNRLAVSAEIPATEAGDLKPGNPVELLTEPPVFTKLSFISPVVEQSNDTVLVRALLPAKSRLRPGQFARLRIVTAVHADCLAAPDESAVTDESGKTVISLVKGDEAAQIPVQTGLRENGWVEIEAPGLKAGDTVVTLGAYGLPAKTKVRIQNPASDETPATSSTPNEVRHQFVPGPVHHATCAVDNVHRGGIVRGRNFLRVAHTVVHVSTDEFSAHRHPCEQRHHARRRNDGHSHAPD